MALSFQSLELSFSMSCRNDSGAEKAGKTTAKSVQYIIATESVTPETEAAAEKRAEDKDEGDGVESSLRSVSLRKRSFIAIIDLLSRVVDISNLTKHIEEEYLSSEEDALNRYLLSFVCGPAHIKFNFGQDSVTSSRRIS